jgi:DNA-binding Lrp family transcriptional regulator
MRTDDGGRVDAADARLLERLHGGFPLVDRPFAQVADELGLGEDEVIERLCSLLSHGVLTRVAAIVNAWPEVAHNYRREARGHVDAAGACAPRGCRCGADSAAPALNMWFVVAAESAEAAERAMQRIEADTGLTVWRFPKEREFKVELKLPLAGVADGAV